MVTSDDDMTTDIIVEGDQEEIARMVKVRRAPRAGRGACGHPRAGAPAAVCGGAP